MNYDSPEIKNEVRDEELYRQFLAGKTASYDQLMIRYGDRLTFYLNGYLHNWQDAEDLMIEAFARIMAKRPSLRTSNFKAYLYKTARNLASRFHERRTRFRIFSLDDLGEDPGGEELTERLLVNEERNKALHRCLERIDPELREALWLFYFEEMSYADAASVMGVNTKRIDHLLSRGKEHLKKELAKEGITNAYE